MITLDHFPTFDSHTSSLLRKMQAIQMPHPKENKQIAWRWLMFEILLLIQTMPDGQKWKQWTSTLPEHLQVPIEKYYNLISVHVLWIKNYVKSRIVHPVLFTYSDMNSSNVEVNYRFDHAKEWKSERKYSCCWDVE